MGSPNINNSGALQRSVACGAASAVAAGAGDATKVTGATINRATYNYPGSAKLCISYLTSLTAAKTLSFAVEYEESSDGSSWDTAVAIEAATVVATGALTASVGQREYDLDLSARKQYVRYNVTPDLSHTSTDTVVFAANAILGGARSLPASGSVV